MIVLLDTSTAECHLAIYKDFNEKILEDKWQANRELAEKLFGYIERKLHEVGASWSDISGLGVMKGPGSFTGLRIGASVGNALAADRHIPIVGTSGDDWQEIALARLKNNENEQVVLPDYGRPARITQPRK